MDLRKAFSLPRVLYLAIFLVPLVYNPWGGANPFELTKHSYFVGLISLFAAFLFIKAMQDREIALPFNKNVAVVFSLWVLSFILSTVFSIAPIESFWGTYDRLQGFVSAFFYGVFFLLGLFLFCDEEIKTWFFRVTFGVGLLMGAHAILQKLGLDFLLSKQEIFAGRSFATLGSPTALGQFLIFPIAIGLFYLSEWRKKAFSPKIIIFISAALFTMIAALLFSENRASIIGILVAAGLFIFMAFKRTGMRIIFVSVGIALALAIASFGHFDLRSLGTRATLWTASAPLVAQYPLLGSGPETYYQTIQAVLPTSLYGFERMTDIPDRSHNILLDALLMRGGLGFALWIINILFLAFVLFWKLAKTTASKIALFAIIAHTISMQFSFMNTVDVIFAVSMWAILLLETLKWKTIRLQFGRAMCLMAALVLLAVFYFGFSNAYRLVRTDTLFGGSIESFLQANNSSIPLQHFDQAIGASSEYAYLYRSVFILFRDDLLKNPELVPIMKSYAEKLNNITGESFQAKFANAMVALAEGNIAKADLFFLNVEEKAPNWPLLWMEWGEVLFAREDFKGAAEKFERLLFIAPPYWKWGPELEKHTPADREKYRIFRKSNQRFFEALAMLITCYERIGNLGRAEELKKYF